MRFLMIGISIIIGVILVGVVFSVTTDLTQPKQYEKSLIFEVIEYDVSYGKFNNDVYNFINKFGIIGADDTITNLTDSKLNGNTVNFERIILRNGTLFTFFFSSNDGSYDFEVYTDNTFFSEGYNATVGDTWTITLLVDEPAQISSTSAILIALVPLLFATGVILYTYNTALRGREE